MQFEAIAQEWFDAQILRGPKRARDQTVLNTRTSREKFICDCATALLFREGITGTGSRYKGSGTTFGLLCALFSRGRTTQRTQ